MADKRVVDLAQGRLVLFLEGTNLFGLTRCERNFLSSLLDLLDSLEDAIQDERFCLAAKIEAGLEGDDG